MKTPYVLSSEKMSDAAVSIMKSKKIMDCRVRGNERAWLNDSFGNVVPDVFDAKKSTMIVSAKIIPSDAFRYNVNGLYPDIDEKKKYPMFASVNIINVMSDFFICIS